jgi:hypothetical protein
MERIINPPANSIVPESSKNTAYEWHTGSFGTTSASVFFPGTEWILTPEMIQPGSRKKPDLVIEKMVGDKPQIHVMMEYKGDNGDRFEKALKQLVDTIHETVENMGYTLGEDLAMFLVVIRGRKIGFFEYHNLIPLKNGSYEDTPTMYGCTSLLGSCQEKGPVIVVQGASKIFYDADKLKGAKGEEEIRELAANYKVDSVLDLEKHEKEIQYLYNWIAGNQPRNITG